MARDAPSHESWCGSPPGHGTSHPQRLVLTTKLLRIRRSGSRHFSPPGPVSQPKPSGVLGTGGTPQRRWSLSNDLDRFAAEPALARCRDLALGVPLARQLVLAEFRHAASRPASDRRAST